MTIRENIIQKIEAHRVLPNPVTEETNLYRDLGFDSLSFIRLLMEAEEEYGIVFEIGEMERCLEVGYFVLSVENKVRERRKEDDKRIIAQSR